MKNCQHAHHSRRLPVLILGVSAVALLGFASTGWAASGTWLDTGTTDGLWSDSSNWVSGTIPGATSGTTNTDIANFTTAVGTYGTAANPVMIDANRNLGGFEFYSNAGSYTIGTTGGNPLLLTNESFSEVYGTLTGTNVIETINAPLVLESIYSFYNDGANGSGAGSATLDLGGSITGASGTTALYLGGTNTNANTVSGIIGNGTATSMDVVKNGSSTWDLTGSNTYTGGTFVANGILDVNSITNSGVASEIGAGSIIVLGGGSGGVGNNTTGTFQFNGAAGGSSNRSISITGDTSGLNGGIIENTVAGQTLTLSGSVDTSINNSITQSLEVTGVGNGVFSGNIANSTGLLSVTKAGTGTWTFSGANTYSGGTTVSGGTLMIGNSKALGFGGRQMTAVGTTTVNSGATLDLNGTGAVSEPIILNGTGNGGVGALVNNSGTSASLASGITGLTAPALGIGSGLSSAPSVVISGTGSGATATASLGLTTASITSVSGGTGWNTGDTVAILTAGSINCNSAVGTVTASGGAITGITITEAGSGYTTAPIAILALTGSGNGGTITGNANNFTVGGFVMTNAGSNFTGTPTITVGGVAAPQAAAVLSSVNLATNSTIGGSGMTTINSVISGSAGLTKVGTGDLFLYGANTYTGQTTVNSGDLAVYGSIASSSLTLVNTGGALFGSGTVGALTLQGGSMSPGAYSFVGTLNTGNLLFSGGTFQMDIASATSADQFNVSGTAGLGANTKLTLNLLGGYIPAAGTSWTLVNNDGSDPFATNSFYFTTFTGAPITDSTPFTLGTVTYDLQYDAGPGDNDVVLSVLTAPEPGTAMLLLAGLPLLASRRRRASL